MLIVDVADGLALQSHLLGIALSETGSCDADSTTGSEASLGLLRQWLSDCKEKHPQCRPPKTGLPTRVIDIGLPGENQHPRLLEAQPGRDGEYLALSHCWGKPELREQNQAWSADPENLLPLGEWPQTFKHTAEIAHRLGIRYIWIDVACIKQGDDSDFVREAPRMAEYYSGATLVIAADHAEDSRGGCFATRDPLPLRPCPIEVGGYHGEDGLFVTVRPSAPWDVTNPKQDGAGLHPLRSRAWCFQEATLARRIAIFAWDQLQWSCLMHMANERRPAGFENSPQHSSRRDLRIFLHHPPSKTPRVASPDGDNQGLAGWQEKMGSRYLWDQPGNLPGAVRTNPAYLRWYDAVEYFTKASLTYKRDTLPAISGLAKIFHIPIGRGDEYLAGLWSGNLVRGLLWAIFTPVPVQQTDSTYLAPSWSWASRSGQQISYFFDERIMCGLPDRCNPVRLDIMAALEPRNVSVSIALKHQGAIYGEITEGQLRCSVRLLHGGKIGSVLLRRESMYGSAHPGYHRGSGFVQSEDLITTWRVTVPARWADASGELEGEIALDGLTVTDRIHSVAGTVLGTRRPRSAAQGVQEVSVLLLWPFEFRGNRCIGLGLVRTGARMNEYRRVGRVEFAIPYEKLWAWTEENADFEDIVIV